MRGRGLGKSADCCWQAVGGVNFVGCLPSQQPAWWSPLIAFVCWKTLSFPHFLSVLCSRSPLSPCWPSRKQDRSSPPHRLSSWAIIPIPSPLLCTHWSERDENRLFQLGKAVGSVCFRLPHCCCSLYPPTPPHPYPLTLHISPLEIILSFSVFLPPFTSFPSTARGGSGKRWVTFKHFHPFHSAADLLMLAPEALIGGEVLSLAGCQDFFPPGWCKFSILTPSVWIYRLSRWLVFLRALLTYLDDLDIMECLNFGRAGIPWQYRQYMHVCFMSARICVSSQVRAQFQLTVSAGCCAQMHLCDFGSELRPTSDDWAKASLESCLSVPLGAALLGCQHSCQEWVALSLDKERKKRKRLKWENVCQRRKGEEVNG